MQYQTWAQMMLPYYHERRVARAKGLLTPYERERSRSRSFSRSRSVSPRSQRGSLVVDTATVTVQPVWDSNWTESPIAENQSVEWPNQLEMKDVSVPGSARTSFDLGSGGANTADESSHPRAKAHTTVSGFSQTTDTTMVDREDVCSEDQDQDQEQDQFLPPLPVLMAWHAHILQPYKYIKELDGAYSALRDFPFPLREVVSLAVIILAYHHSWLRLGWELIGSGPSY